MNIMPYQGPCEIVTIGLTCGELLLESIRSALQSRNITNGAVISAAGTLKSCHLHYVTHTGFPPNDQFYTINEPLELLSANGIIAAGEPHLHAVVSSGEERMWGGHLENGSEVLYLAEVTVIVFNDLRMTRRLDPVKGTKMLGPA